MRSKSQPYRRIRGDQNSLFFEEPRLRSRFDMLFHSIRSSNTLSLGSGKPNCVLGFSVNRVWLASRFYTFILLHYYEARALLISTINTVILCVLLWLGGLRRRSVDREMGTIQVRSSIRNYFVFLLIIQSVQHVDKAVVNCLFAFV